MEHARNKAGLVAGLLAIAVAAPLMLSGGAAQAAGALFRGQVTYFGAFAPWVITFPPSKGPDKAPPATGYVGPTLPAGKVVLPRSFIDYYGSYYCVPGQCFAGYPISGGFYSYVNGQARFRPNNPYGPTATTTVVFPTTKGNPVPNYGSGNPVTPTTRFSGRYDFSRGGSVQIVPGPNRFSGTMRFIYGPNASFYQYVTINYPFASRGYGNFNNDGTELDEIEVGDVTVSFVGTRFRLTALGANKAKTPGGAYITAMQFYLNSIAPWTTGMMEGYNPLGTYLTRSTHTGYNNVTSQGVGGVLSVVRPRLVHMYSVNSDPNVPTTVPYQAMRAFQLKVFFLPEPGAMLLLGVGLATLAGLAHLRRR